MHRQRLMNTNMLGAPCGAIVIVEISSMKDA